MDILLSSGHIGRALDEYTDQTAERWGADPVLAMAGTDHTLPDPHLGQWLREASRPDRPIRVATLEEYLHRLPVEEDLPVVDGELRSHARANLLPGVLSIRQELKAAMTRAELALDEAERVSAAWAGPDQEVFLDLAWRKVVESSAHDSVVGSGTDETCEQVGVRLNEATQIARTVTDTALAPVLAATDQQTWSVVNCLPRSRTTVARVEAECTDRPERLIARTDSGEELPTQLLFTAPEILADEMVDATDLPRILHRIHRRELFGRQIASYSLTPGRLVLNLARSAPDTPFDIIELREEVNRATSESPRKWRVTTRALPLASALVAVPVSPGGLTRVRLAPTSAQTPRHTEGLRIDNGILQVGTRPDGTLDLFDHGRLVASGLGRIVDGGDAGDTYTYCPPADDLLVSTPRHVCATVLERGPVRWRLKVDRTYSIPTDLDRKHDSRTERIAPVSVETLADLHAGEDFLRLTVSFVNRSRNHRVRLHLPLPHPAHSSEAEGQFTVTHRGLHSEGGWGEDPLPTFPASSFIHAGGLTVLLDHQGEYEVTDDGQELALTLLRAVGQLSRNVNRMRDEPAGSEIPVPGAQAPGRNITTRIAVLPSLDGWLAAEALDRADDFRHPPLVRRGTGAADKPVFPSHPLAVEGRGVAVSCTRPVSAGTEIRLVSYLESPTTVTVTGNFDTVLAADLLGTPEPDPLARRCSGRAPLTIAPHQILTLILIT